jgi:hypothetical protein
MNNGQHQSSLNLLNFFLFSLRMVKITANNILHIFSDLEVKAKFTEIFNEGIVNVNKKFDKLNVTVSTLRTELLVQDR